MKTTLSTARLGTALSAALAIGLAVAQPSTASAQSPVAVAPTDTINLSAGRGSLVRLPAPIADLFISNEAVADVQIRSSTQLYLFGKGTGETTVYATDSRGRVVWSTNVRVGKNITTIDDMLRLAMPEAEIQATPMNGIILLTGTVAQPTDVEEATRLVQAFAGEGTEVVARLRTATPLQVNLQVKIAEVSRSVAKEIGVNLAANDSTGGFQFGIGRGVTGTTTAATIDQVSGYPVATRPLPDGGSITGRVDPVTGAFIDPRAVASSTSNFANAAVGNTLGFAGRLLGLDLIATLNLLENQGLVTTLANPNLTALSGETATFLAGGEFPVPIAQALGSTSIEYKSYGVTLSFTPYVLASGRISMRVRPEVSELSSAGAIRVNGTTVPATTTRRAETTVELGSGQSLMIGGLLRNVSNATIEKAPFLGDLPILGALFRSNGFRREQTELMIVVTPYLVKPVSANRITLPTDGYRAPLEADRILRGQLSDGVSGAKRPLPSAGPPRTVSPRPGEAAPTTVVPARPSAARGGGAQPGFKL